MKLRSGILISALGVALAGLLANDPATFGVAWSGAAPAAGARPAAWQEVKWPFLLDEWGTGRAFRCAPADCGTGIDLYLRAKIGFCNCSTGVSDNADLDRVSDLELFSDAFVGLTDGHAVSVGRFHAAPVHNRFWTGRQCERALELACACIHVCVHARAHAHRQHVELTACT